MSFYSSVLQTREVRSSHMLSHLPGKSHHWLVQLHTAPPGGRVMMAKFLPSPVSPNLCVCVCVYNMYSSEVLEVVLSNLRLLQSFLYLWVSDQISNFWLSVTMARKDWAGSQIPIGFAAYLIPVCLVHRWVIPRLLLLPGHLADGVGFSISHRNTFVHRWILNFSS